MIYSKINKLPYARTTGQINHVSSDMRHMLVTFTIYLRLEERLKMHLLVAYFNSSRATDECVHGSKFSDDIPKCI